MGARGSREGTRAGSWVPVGAGGLEPSGAHTLTMASRRPSTISRSSASSWLSYSPSACRNCGAGGQGRRQARARREQSAKRGGALPERRRRAQPTRKPAPPSPARLLQVLALLQVQGGGLRLADRLHKGPAARRHRHPALRAVYRGSKKGEGDLVARGRQRRGWREAWAGGRNSEHGLAAVGGRRHSLPGAGQSAGARMSGQGGELTTLQTEPAAAAISHGGWLQEGGTCTRCGTLAGGIGRLRCQQGRQRGPCTAPERVAAPASGAPQVGTQGRPPIRRGPASPQCSPTCTARR